MDERKKLIAGLKAEIQENRHSLDSMLEEFGETLLRRIESSSFSEKKPFKNDLTEYGRFKREIEEAEAAILAAGAEIKSLEWLEEKVSEKEKEFSAEKERLSVLYRELGKQLLEDPRSEKDMPRERYNSLSVEIEDLERRIDEQGSGGTDNVFALIGKGAKTMLDRTSLSRKRKARELLCEKTGMIWVPGTAAPETEKAVSALKASFMALEEDLDGLLKERRKLHESSGGESGLSRRIRLLGNAIEKTEEEFRCFRKDFAGRVTERKKRYTSLYNGKDQAMLEKIKACRKAIQDAEKKAAKLKASIAVDEEKAAIKKMEKAVLEHRKRIDKEENAVKELKEGILKAEQHIVELEKN
jgi:hypothetical protein